MQHVSGVKLDGRCGRQYNSAWFLLSTCRCFNDGPIAERLATSAQLQMQLTESLHASITLVTHAWRMNNSTAGQWMANKYSLTLAFASGKEDIHFFVFCYACLRGCFNHTLFRDHYSVQHLFANCATTHPACPSIAQAPTFLQSGCCAVRSRCG